MQNIVRVQEKAKELQTYSTMKRKRVRRRVAKVIMVWKMVSVLVPVMKRHMVTVTKSVPKARPISAAKEAAIRERWRFKLLVGPRGKGPYREDRPGWPLPREGKPGRWHEPHAKEPLVLCQIGLHLSRAETVHGFGRLHIHGIDDLRLFVAEIHPDAQIVFEDPHRMQSHDKIAVSKARLVEELPLQQAVVNLRNLHPARYRYQNEALLEEACEHVIKGFLEREKQKAAKAATTPAKVKAAQKKK